MNVLFMELGIKYIYGCHKISTNGSKENSYASFGVIKCKKIKYNINPQETIFTTEQKKSRKPDHTFKMNAYNDRGMLIIQLDSKSMLHTLNDDQSQNCE